MAVHRGSGQQREPDGRDDPADEQAAVPEVVAEPAAE